MVLLRAAAHRASLCTLLRKGGELEQAAHAAATSPLNLKLRTSQVEPKINKTIGDRVLAYPDFFGDSANTQTLLTKGFNSINREHQEMVLLNMVRSLNDSEIFDTIIKSIPIDVMNILVGQEITPKMLLQDKTMLTKRLSVARDEPIPMPVILFIDSLASSISKISTGDGTEKTNLSSMHTPSILKGDAASSASLTPVGLVQHSHIVGQMVRTNINPTEGQRQAGNYLKGAIQFAGLKISIENPAGSYRRPEWPPMQAHYGYVRGTEGADGDAVDCFLRQGAPLDWCGDAYVVNQPDATGEFDEHKVMMGFDSQAEAVRCYLAHYPKDWRMGDVVALSLPELRAWLAGDTTEPLVKDDGGAGWSAPASPTSGIQPYGTKPRKNRISIRAKKP